MEWAGSNVIGEEEKVQFKFQRHRNHNLQRGQIDHRNGNDHRGTNPLNRNCPHWGGYPTTPSSNPLNLDEREDFASNVDGDISLLPAVSRTNKTIKWGDGEKRRRVVGVVQSISNKEELFYLTTNKGAYFLRWLMFLCHALMICTALCWIMEHLMKPRVYHLGKRKKRKWGTFVTEEQYCTNQELLKKLQLYKCSFFWDNDSSLRWADLV